MLALVRRRKRTAADRSGQGGRGKYVLIAQDRLHVELTRRGQAEPIVLTRGEEVLTLDAIEFAVTLADLYE